MKLAFPSFLPCPQGLPSQTHPSLMKPLNRFFASATLLFAGISLTQGHVSLPAGENSTPPTKVKQVRIAHETKKIEGWTVLIDQSLFSEEHAEEGKLALRILAQRLHRIVMRLPEKPRQEMQKVPIFLDRAHPLGNAHFHPSKEWLVRNGYDPAMTEAIHLTSAKTLINSAAHPSHGSVVLHELAHAYHFRVLGFEHPAILEGYTQFCDSEKFDAVTYPNGRQRPHYGLMNHKEYFAELTETFFTQNNSYPYNRTELMLEHPESYLLIAKIWGVDVPAPKGKWATDPSAWDLRMIATLKSQRGDHEEALALVAQAKQIEPDNERIDSLQKALEETAAKDANTNTKSEGEKEKE